MWEDIRVLVANGEFNFFFTDPVLATSEIPERKVTCRSRASLNPVTNNNFKSIPDDSFNEPDKIKTALWDCATEAGYGAVLWPLRYSLTGRKQSPDPFLVASIIGKDATLRRIAAAIEQLRTP